LTNPAGEKKQSSNADKDVHPSARQISSNTEQVISHIADLTNPTKEKSQCNRQKSSNTDKDVLPSDRQISSITKQVISHIADLANLTIEKYQCNRKNSSNTNNDIHPSYREFLVDDIMKETKDEKQHSLLLQTRQSHRANFKHMLRS